MTPVKQDALYLFEHFKQSGSNLADELFNRIIKEKKLTTMEVVVLRNEFSKLVKASN